LVQDKAFQTPLQPGCGRILMDFKANLAIGMSAEQICEQYYKQSFRQLLGIWIQYPGSDNQLFFDFISEDLTKDNVFVATALKTVLSSNEFLSLNLKKIEVWSDGARHFRNTYVISYI
jgi:hypothetical protein